MNMNGELYVPVTVHREQSVNREKTNKMQQSDVYYQLLSQHVKPTRCNNQKFIINFCLNMLNQQDATIRCLLSKLSQHVSGIIMPIFRRTKTVCYCMWCIVLDVVGSGCGALRCRVRAL